MVDDGRLTRRLDRRLVPPSLPSGPPLLTLRVPLLARTPVLRGGRGMKGSVWAVRGDQRLAEKDAAISIVPTGRTGSVRNAARARRVCDQPALLTYYLWRVTPGAIKQQGTRPGKHCCCLTPHHNCCNAGPHRLVHLSYAVMNKIATGRGNPPYARRGTKPQKPLQQPGTPTTTERCSSTYRRRQRGMPNSRPGPPSGQAPCSNPSAQPALWT
jgi:hypothetical protein